jgi:hypothetical protein
MNFKEWRRRRLVKSLIKRLEGQATEILELMEPFEGVAATWANRELDAMGAGLDEYFGPSLDRQAQVIQTVAAGHAFAALLDDLAQTQRELLAERDDE